MWREFLIIVLSCYGIALSFMLLACRKDRYNWQLLSQSQVELTDSIRQWAHRRTEILEKVLQEVQKREVDRAYDLYHAERAKTMEDSNPHSVVSRVLAAKVRASTVDREPQPVLTDPADSINVEPLESSTFRGTAGMADPTL